MSFLLKYGLIALVLLGTALPVFSESYSLSDVLKLAHFNEDPWVEFHCYCSVNKNDPNAQYAGSITGTINVDTLGTTRVNPPAPTYSSLTETYPPEYTPGTEWCYTYDQHIQVVCYVPNTANLTRFNYDKGTVVYDAGTGLQNAYAVALALNKHNRWETATACGSGSHRESYDYLQLNGAAANIGSDFILDNQVTNGGSYQTDSTGLGAPAYYKNGFGWGPGVTITTSDIGPNPPTYTTTGVSDFISLSKTSQGGVGLDNLEQVPIYPAALLFCTPPTGTACSTSAQCQSNETCVDSQCREYIGQVAPTCGDTVFYKSTKYNRYNSNYVQTLQKDDYLYEYTVFARGWPADHCGLRRADASYGRQSQDTGAAVIGNRYRTCNPAYAPPEWKTLVIDQQYGTKMSDACPYESSYSTYPTSENIQKRNDKIAEYLDPVWGWGYSDCVVKTYSASQATPDTYDWYNGVDVGGGQYGSLASWAAGVYIKYTQTCTQSYDPPGIQPTFYCELDAAPSPALVNAPVTWTAKMYTLNSDGTPTQVTWPRTVEWEGSENISLTNSSLTLLHTYTTPTSQYMEVNVTASNSGVNYSATCSNTLKIKEPLDVTCLARPQTQVIRSIGDTSISFGAYARGGVLNSGVDYTYNWTFSPAPTLVYEETSSPYITADYSSAGTKTATVVVTDSEGTTDSATCQGVIEPFEVSCSWETSDGTRVVYPNEEIKWKAMINGASGTASVTWSGTDSLSGTDTINPADPDNSISEIAKTYATTGAKTASVTVTRSGFSKTAQCGTVNVIAEPAGPTCIASASPSSVNIGSDSTISVTVLKFTNDISNVTVNCGDSATAQGTDTCYGLNDEETCNFLCRGYTAGGSVQVTLSNDASPVQSATCLAPITIGTSPSCSLSANPATAESGGDSAITITYANFSSAISTVDVNCGSNATDPASQPVCSGTSGTCTFTCSDYSADSTATAALNGVACTPVVVESGSQTCSISPKPVNVDLGENAEVTVNFSGFTNQINDIDDFTIECEGGSDPQIVACSSSSCTINCGAYENEGLIRVNINDTTVVSCGETKVYIKPENPYTCPLNNGTCLPTESCTGTVNNSYTCPDPQVCCFFPTTANSDEDIALGLYEKKSQSEFTLETSPTEILQLESKITLESDSTATSATLIVTKARAGEQGIEIYNKLVSFPQGQRIIYVALADENINTANFTRGTYIYEARLIKMKSSAGEFTDAKKSNNADSISILVRSKRLTAAPEINVLMIIVIALSIAFISRFNGK